MTKALLDKQQDEVRNFIRLQLGATVARSASHIRSKRAAALRAGIDEVRYEYAMDHGAGGVCAFLECVEAWLLERGNTVAAAALRAYLETEMPELRQEALAYNEALYLTQAVDDQADALPSEVLLRDESEDLHEEDVRGAVQNHEIAPAERSGNALQHHGSDHGLNGVSLNGKNSSAAATASDSLGGRERMRATGASRAVTPHASRGRRFPGSAQTARSYRSYRSR